ncbi:protein kinase, partial [Myxococcota bacterium]|nr:protein kinase [Myxococcota bacterium]
VDFGIAKAEARSTKTQAGVLKGKFAYMSPEQIIDQDLDRRSDIFALGSVLFEVITGTVLFSGDSDFQVLEKIRDSETPQISDFVDNPPKRLQIILEKALAKEPEDRFEWASDMADDLLNLRLSDDGLFASKQASKFMKQLYKNDLEDLQRRLVEYEKLDLIKIKRDESLPAHQKETAVIAASPELLAAGKPEKTTTVQNIDLHTKSDSNITGEVRRSKGRTIPIEGQTVVSAAPKGMNTLDKRSTIGGIAALVFIVGLSATFFFSRSSNENNENQQPSEPTQQTAPVVEATPKTAPNAETAPEKQKDSKSAVTQEEENKKVSAAAEAKEKEAKTEAKTEKKKTPKKTTPVKRVVPTDPNGKLSILAMGQTQCKVSVAGRTIGTIPLFDYKIPAGTYTVKVKCKNGKSFVASRKIRRGKVTKLMIKPSDWK